MNQHAKAMDDLFIGAVADGVLPGVVAVVADRDGEVYSGAFGVRDTSTGDPVTTDTLYGIASMTKLASTTAVLQLVEQGLVDLDTPVGDLLPAYDDLLVIDGFDGAGQPVLRASTSRGTIRQLLSYTTGSAHPTWNAVAGRYAEAEGIPLSALSGTSAVFGIPLVSDPGTEFSYGLNMDWVGPLIEAVSGRPFLEVLGTGVLDPLGMRDTVAQRSADQLRRTAKVHVRASAGGWVPLDAGYYGDGVVAPEFWPAGHCLYSTAPDFLRLQGMVLAGGSYGGERLLRPESVEAMLTNQIGDLEIGVMETAIPAASCDLPLEGWKWGLGIAVNESGLPGGRSPGSAGWMGGWNTFFWIDRNRGLAAGMYTQATPLYDPAIVQCFTRFEALVSALV